MMLVVTRNETAATLEAPANVLSLSRHVPSHSGSATRSVAQNEARKRRASERHVVGCCEELGGGHMRLCSEYVRSPQRWIYHGVRFYHLESSRRNAPARII